MLDLIGTALVGPKEQGLKLMLTSFNRCGCQEVHVLVDTLDIQSWKLLQDYGCVIHCREWNWEFGPARQVRQRRVTVTIR